MGAQIASSARTRTPGLQSWPPAVLLVLLVVAILTRAPISIDVGDSSLDRQSYVAFVIDVVVTLGLS